MNQAKSRKGESGAGDKVDFQQADFGHPLEVIPFFRRTKENRLLDLLYTFIWGMGFCAFFFALYASVVPRDHWPHMFYNDFVISMSISYTIHGLYELGNALLGAWPRKARGWQRAAYHMIVPTIGVFAGYAIAVAIIAPTAVRNSIFTPGVMLSIVITSVLVSGVLVFFYLMRESELRSKEHLAAEQRRALESERRALEAQLRMLQAQIEPHFLYNTLANAVGLIQPKPDSARLLLERLIDYLRATLTASRETDSTLQYELATLGAYLDLMAVRMGDRLRYSVSLPDELAQIKLPPMLLQPVVENAIQHGLEPKIEGGEISVVVSASATELIVVVADSGVGFSPSATPRPGGGIGLSNLRERLQALYGSDAHLSIADNLPCGVKVTLSIPLTALQR